MMAAPLRSITEEEVASFHRDALCYSRQCCPKSGSSSQHSGLDDAIATPDVMSSALAAGRWAGRSVPGGEVAAAAASCR